MKWYKTLNRKQKAQIRWSFEVCTGITLNQALRIFPFSQCMDLLKEKLKIEGFNL